MIDPAALPGPRRAALAAAAGDLGRAAAELRRGAGSPLAALTGGAAPEPFRHYPGGDVYDGASHAQFYFHTHRVGEVGHVHLFLRPRGMPAGLAPLAPTGEPDAPCHLIAVGLGADGWPDTLFTTNRWVTGEDWYAAAAVVAMLPRFRMDGSGAAGAVAAWLSALLAVVAPLVEDLVGERDAVVAAWARSHPGFALDDRDLEVPSSCPLDLGAWLGGLLAG